MDFNRLFARARGLLLTPRTEWPAVAAEPATVGSVYSGYVVLIALLPAIAQFIKYSVLGFSVPLLGTYRSSVSAGLSSALSYYVLSLISVFVLALIIDALAPRFGATKDRVQAVKTAAYAYTAAWVGGIGVIVPGIGTLLSLIGGIYSIYLLYLGLPYTMKAPPEKATGYTVLIVIAGIVLGLVVAAVSSAVIGRAGLGGVAALGAGSAAGGGSFTSNSAGGALQEIAARVEQAGKQMDAAQKSGDAAAQVQAAGNVLGAVLGGGTQVDALSTDRIKSFLPTTLAGLKQTSSSAQRNGALGMQVSEAKATYGDGSGRSVDLEITDMAAARGLMGLAAWANVEEDKQTQSGYEKTYKQGENVIHEEWDNSARHGEYSALLAGRFMVTARGDAGGIDELRGAVGTVDLAGLAALRNEGAKAPQ